MSKLIVIVRVTGIQVCSPSLYSVHQRPVSAPGGANRMSLVQIGHYVQAGRCRRRGAPQKQSDGKFSNQTDLSSKLGHAVRRHSQGHGAFVKALVDLPAGTHLLGVSEFMIWPQWTELWGEIHGVQAGFKQVSEEEYFQGVPEPLAVELAETFRFVDEFWYTGGDLEMKTGKELGVDIAVTSIEKYIKTEDWLSVV